MQKQYFTLGAIPCVLWGAPASRLFIAVHGDQSHKEDAVPAQFAQLAAEAGYQVLSFDLPEHGARTDTCRLCNPPNCVQDLTTVLQHAQTLAADISLFACSLGAYFSLLAYGEFLFSRCLFLSPVVDMQRLISNMMTWFSVSEARLRQEGKIATPIGKTLDWDYYTYIKEHPVTSWPSPTGILYGEKDALSEYDCVSAFAGRFHCGLTVLEGGEHFFHTPEHLAFFSRWVSGQL